MQMYLKLLIILSCIQGTKSPSAQINPIDSSATPFDTVGLWWTFYDGVFLDGRQSYIGVSHSES